jgi:hypothetical protein
MAERKIIRGVRTDAKTYTPGMEAELAKVLSPEEVQRLSDKGYLQGDWGAAPAKDAAREPVKDAPKPATAPAKEK